ncbi:MAG: hypothetical protein GXO99_01425 [Nitrospirae bacterium]|nr:hypothetical protein [Nitrospirota bacterium]
MNKILIKNATRELLTNLLPLLQQGILMKVTAGSSVRDFLISNLCLDEEYIDRRIQSILLNGRPVDDPSGAKIKDGVTIALSSSMPGLVGATLRRCSPVASLRSTLTYKESSNIKSNCQATVRLKLFNLIMSEIGPFMLKQGVMVEAKRIQEILNKLNSLFDKDRNEVFLNNETIEPVELLKVLSQDDGLCIIQIETITEL